MNYTVNAPLAHGPVGAGKASTEDPLTWRTGAANLPYL